MTTQPGGPVGGLAGAACPCGSGRAYGLCCAPLHHGEREARTAEELMRSRYAAYALGDAAYLERTWHPKTRPDTLRLDDGPRWVGLEVTQTTDGREGDRSGEVEFVARHEDGALHERSRFVRRAGRWVYVDGDLLD